MLYDVEVNRTSDLCVVGLAVSVWRFVSEMFDAMQLLEVHLFVVSRATQQRSNNRNT
jgi:hypothetical protein